MFSKQSLWFWSGAQLTSRTKHGAPSHTIGDGERERTHTIGQVLSLTCDKPPPILPLMVKPSQCGIHTIPMPQY